MHSKSVQFSMPASPETSLDHNPHSHSLAHSARRPRSPSRFGPRTRPTAAATRTLVLLEHKHIRFTHRPPGLKPALSLSRLIGAALEEIEGYLRTVDTGGRRARSDGPAVAENGKGATT